jgi:hypothetical protein
MTNARRRLQSALVTRPRGALGRARWSRATSQAEPVHFPDDGVARNAAHLLGDLTCGMTFRPKLLEERYALIGPAHYFPLFSAAEDGEITCLTRQAAHGHASHEADARTSVSIS